MRDLEALDLERHPTLRLMRRVYELRANLIAYNAVYTALAEALMSDLLTADRRVANAPGSRCAFRVIA